MQLNHYLIIAYFLTQLTFSLFVAMAIYFYQEITSCYLVMAHNFSVAFQVIKSVMDGKRNSSSDRYLQGKVDMQICKERTKVLEGILSFSSQGSLTRVTRKCFRVSWPAPTAEYRTSLTTVSYFAEPTNKSLLFRLLSN